jgi:Rps23 Pro-64 3,4-dihydroxylase Tpa1-like proline 4-hydroxylase
VYKRQKEWRWEWGGLLHLFDKSPWDNGKVIKVIKPSYNSLVLFKLPRWHHVSEVARSANAKRLAFSGWLNFVPKTPEKT